jgi:hypothetical protein
MRYRFVEIGCCDFNTQCDTLSDEALGLCVDPIKYYLDNLPVQTNLFKDNSAISNKKQTVTLYHIPEATIKTYQLPIWLKGCNRIESMHPTAVKELRARNLPLDLIKTDIIITKTYEDLVLQYNCEDIDYLKIDTEGNEPAIIDSLYDFYKKNNSPKYNKPQKINIEAFTGILVSESDIETAKNQLFDLGYIIAEINPPDIIFILPH